MYADITNMHANLETITNKIVTNRIFAKLFFCFLAMQQQTNKFSGDPADFIAMYKKNAYFPENPDLDKISELVAYVLQGSSNVDTHTVDYVMSVLQKSDWDLIRAYSSIEEVEVVYFNRKGVRDAIIKEQTQSLAQHFAVHVPV